MGTARDTKGPPDTRLLSDMSQIQTYENHHSSDCQQVAAMTALRLDASAAMGYIDTQLFINGKWQASAEGKTLPVPNR